MLFYQNIEAGYDYDICYKCEMRTTNPSGVELDFFEISDEINFEQKSKCDNALSPKFTLADSDIFFNIETTTSIRVIVLIVLISSSSSFYMSTVLVVILLL